MSDNVLARRLGLHNFSGRVEHVKNNKSRHFKHLTILTGFEDCLSNDFDAS